jgi:hypothetical protein
MEEKICDCECHKDGTELIHFMSCCFLCGQKYIFADGKIDMVRYEKLKKEHQDEVKE